MYNRTKLGKERVGTLKCRNIVGFHMENENHLKRSTIALSRMNTVEFSKGQSEEGLFQSGLKYIHHNHGRRHGM